MDVPVQNWAVPDRIPIGYTTLFSGEGAAGKSLIQLQGGVAHALDVNWLGTSCNLGARYSLTPKTAQMLFIAASTTSYITTVAGSPTSRTGSTSLR